MEEIKFYRGYPTKDSIYKLMDSHFGSFSPIHPSGNYTSNGCLLWDSIKIQGLMDDFILKIKNIGIDIYQYRPYDHSNNPHTYGRLCLKSKSK